MSVQCKAPTNEAALLGLGKDLPLHLPPSLAAQQVHILQRVSKSLSPPPPCPLPPPPSPSPHATNRMRTRIISPFLTFVSQGQEDLAQCYWACPTSNVVYEPLLVWWGSRWGHDRLHPDGTMSCDGQRTSQCASCRCCSGSPIWYVGLPDSQRG